MKFAFVNKHLGQHKVKQMCHMIGVSSSGYYLWKNRGKSRREEENAFLLEKIKGIHRLSDYTYGSPRITHALRNEFIYCSQPRGGTTDEKERHQVEDEAEVQIYYRFSSQTAGC